MPAVLSKCCTCGQEKPETDMIILQKQDDVKGTKDQRRCKPCHSVRERIRNVLKYELGLKVIHDMNYEEKQPFMSECATLFGENLKKHVREKAYQITIQKQTTSFGEDGDMEEESVIEERYKHEPETLANIREHAFTYEHPVTKKKLVWIPKIHMKRLRETFQEKGTSSHVEADYKFKKQKVVKPDGDTVEDTLEEAAGDGKPKGRRRSNDGPKKLADGVIKRLERVIPQLEEKELAYSQLVMEVTDESNKENIPHRVAELARKHQTDLTTALQFARSKFETKLQTKNEMKEFWEKLKTNQEERENLVAQMNALLGLAAEE